MSTIADLEEAVQRYASIRMMVHPCHPLCYDSVMKRLLTTLALLCALSTFVFASTDPFMEPQVVPFYNYVSISTGYAPNFKISQGTVAQSVPLGLAAGVLANNMDGSFAIGFGSRADFRFGVGADSSDFSLDSLFALEGMARLGRHFGLDFMVGAAVSVVDDEAMEGGSVATMGPGGLLALKIFPTGTTVISIDLGMAVYGQFGMTDSYHGLSAVPYIAFAVDFGAFPYAYIPLSMANMIIY